jgi:hypothetical protein
MSKIKSLMQEDLVNGLYFLDKNQPTHLEKEMHEEMIKLRQQVTTIKKILEECV